MTAHLNESEKPSASTLHREAAVEGRMGRVWLCFFAVLWVYTMLVKLPWTPLYIPSDSSIFLQEAERLLQGKVIYKDFFELTFPGTPATFAVLTGIFGHSLLIPLITSMVLAVALVYLVSLLAAQLLPRNLRLLPPLLLMGIALRHNLDPSHRLFSTVLVVWALILFVRPMSRNRLIFCGILVGMATFYTQTTGVAAIVGLTLALIVDQERRGNLVGLLTWLLVPYSGSVLALTLPFAICSGLHNFWFCTAIFPVRYFPALVPTNNFDAYWEALPHSGWHLRVLPPLLLALAVPLVYPVFALKWWRDKMRVDRGIRAVGLVGFMLLLSVARSPSSIRLSMASPPAWILLSWFLRNKTAQSRVLVWALVGISVVALVATPVTMQRMAQPAFPFPAGRASAVSPDELQRFRYIAENAPPGSYIFDAAWPNEYYLLRLRSPAPVPFVSNTRYTTLEQLNGTIEALARVDTRFILWEPHLGDINSMQEGVLAPLAAYVRQHYVLVNSSDDGVQIWRKKT